MKNDKPDISPEVEDLIDELLDTKGMKTASNDDDLEAARVARDRSLAGRKRHGDFNVAFTDSPDGAHGIGAVIWGEMNPDTPLVVRLLIHALVKVTNDMLKSMPGHTTLDPTTAADKSKLN